MNRDLPRDWESITLGELFEFKYGKGLPHEKRNTRGTVNVYGSNGVVGTHNASLTKGPAIIVGRKGSVGEIHFSLQPCWPIDTTYFVDEFPGDMPARYWELFLKSIRLGQQEKSSAIPGISRNDIYALEVPVPPLAEQQRIVAALDALLPKVETSRKGLERIPAILKRFRQSVLAAACSGRLTADWRKETTNHSSSLLGEIRERRKELWARQRKAKGLSQLTEYLEPAEPSEDFDFDVPESWEKCSMDALTSVITSGSRDWTQYYKDDGSGTFIMAQNIRPLRFERSYRLAVAPPENNRERARSEVLKDDLLVTIVGANTGDSCRVPMELDEHYVCQSVALMRPVLPQLSRFLELFLNSSGHGLAEYKKWIYGEGRPHLSFDNLRETLVCLPPLVEQNEIVRRVEALFKIADRIETRYEETTKRVDDLTQSILAKAFRGELVTQDPKDEPAEKLLEQLRKREQRSKKRAL